MGLLDRLRGRSPSLEDHPRAWLDRGHAMLVPVSATSDSPAAIRAFFEDVRRITGGAFTWDELDVEREGRVLEVTFSSAGRPFFVTLSRADRWALDLDALTVCNRVLEARGSASRLWVVREAGGDLNQRFVVWATEAEAVRLLHQDHGVEPDPTLSYDEAEDDFDDVGEDPPSPS